MRIWLEWLWSELRLAFVPNSSRFDGPYLEANASGVLVRGAATDPCELTNAETLPRAIRQKLRSKKLALSIEPKSILVRNIAAIKFPPSHVKRMALLDVQASTPMSPDTVYLLYRSPETKAKDTSYALVKRHFLDQAVQQIKQHKLAISAIVVKTDEGTFVARQDVLKELDLISTWKEIASKVAAYLLIAFCLLGLGTAAHAYLRLSEAETKVDAASETARASLATLRKRQVERKKRIDIMESTRRQKLERAPIVVVWEELTRVVPDSAWVTNVSIDNENVSFSGFAQSASGLIAGLEASRLFKDPVFAGSVTRDAGGNQERFNIKMKLEAQ